MGSLCPGVHTVLFEASKHLWCIWGLILNVISPVLPPCWDFSFVLGHGVSFLGGIQYSPVDGCSGVSCNFGVLAGEDEHTSFYSAILFSLKLGKEYVKTVYCHSAYLTYMQRTSCEMPSWMKHMLESIILDRQMTSPLWQKVKMN